MKPVGLSLEPLLKSAPDLPVSFLSVNYDEQRQVSKDELIDLLPMPFAATKVHECVISTKERLTYGEQVKEVYSLTFDIPEDWHYDPGGTIGISTQNKVEEVTKLLLQLRLFKVSTTPCIACKLPNSSYKKKLPIFCNKWTSLMDLFLNCVDIRCVPKKLLIRILAEYTSDDKEKIGLLQLCSKSDSSMYLKLIEQKTTFIDLLLSHPSCQPPISSLLEQLPLLLPRPYSISSSPLINPHQIRITFSIEEMNNIIVKEGLCTSMLKFKIKQSEKIENLSLHDNTVKLYLRSNTILKLPDDVNIPLIFIALGTGISPFLGLLAHRASQINHENPVSNIDVYYGCRYEDKDFLCREELHEYVNNNIIKNLYMSYSREDKKTSVRYVQDNLQLNGKHVDEIIGKGGIIYICGNQGAKTSIYETLASILQTYGELTHEQTVSKIKEMEKGGKILQDFWN